MNKKIGLVSYHRDPNYGTMLQAFALAYSIRSLGKECEYINYYEYCRPSYLKQLLSIIYKLVKKIINIKGKSEYSYYNDKDFCAIRKAYNDFHRKYIPYSKIKYYFDTINNLQNEYALFIVGSDQTWSFAVNNNGNTINFLEFVNDNYKKRSYAPSIGSVHIDTDQLNQLKMKLDGFHYLSCRERPNCELLESRLARKVEYVLDPTLLLKPIDWNALLNSNPIINCNYILAYILGKRECVSSFAEKLGAKYNLPVYYVLTRPEFNNKKNIIKSAGPLEFVGLIRNSSFVVTDSFHGTIFSLNFEKEFFSFVKREGGENNIDNDRIGTILDEFGLSHRLLVDDNLNDFAPIPYTEVNQKLDELRDLSFAYLRKIIN